MHVHTIQRNTETGLQEITKYLVPNTLNPSDSEIQEGIRLTKDVIMLPEDSERLRITLHNFLNLYNINDISSATNYQMQQRLGIMLNANVTKYILERTL